MWKKRYTHSLPLASLDCSSSTGRNYVIQNVSTGDQERQVVTLLEGNVLGVTKWQGEFVTEKMFKIEPCSDHAEDYVVSAYGTEKPPMQWVVNDSPSLQVKAYPCDGGGGGDFGEEERLRPRFKKWRFAFQEVSPPGSKKYRIMSKDEDLEYEGNNCLELGPVTES